MTKESKYYENTREDLIRLIPRNARRILDVGCGVGNLSVAIKKKRGLSVEVAGIELDTGASEKAKEKLDKVITGDAEAFVSLPFPEGHFDCIIYGDILEHFVDPWSVLKKYRAMLQPGGYAIASIPNIAHYRILKMLRKKRWDYQKSGILDRCHLRFFTINSIKELFEGAGFKITVIDHIISASNVKKFLNRILFNRLIDSITEQYIIAAQKE